MIKNSIILSLILYNGMLNYINSSLSNMPAQVKIVHLGQLKVAENPKLRQYDYVLDPKAWDCTLYGKSFRWSKVELDESKVYKYYLGTVRTCMKYEIRGSL